MHVEEKDRIVICKSCHRPEYWGQMRWLNGKCTCRDCYRSEWESMRGEQYRWNDLDGNRPGHAGLQQTGGRIEKWDY